MLRLQLEAAQAAALAEADPFWDEGLADGGERSPQTVIADVRAVCDLLGEAPDAPSVLDALAIRWQLPGQDPPESRRLLVLRQQRIAGLCAVLADLEVAGPHAWSDVVDLDDEAGDVAGLATAQALRGMGMGASAALGRGIPPHILLAVYREEMLMAIAEHSDLRSGDEGALSEFRAAVAHDFARELDPIALAAALRIDPSELVRLQGDGLGL